MGGTERIPDGKTIGKEARKIAIRIAVGKENFEEIRKAGACYVDKTDLLVDLVGGTDNQVTVFTRPRRFGKTLNMSMMESFFDISRNSKTVFDGLHVSKNKAFCSEWMNRYPVLCISFKDVDGLDFESAYGQLQAILADDCKKIVSLFDADNRRAMIIEVKKTDSKANMEKSCDEALKQIVDNEYAKNLDEGYQTVLCYGIAFFQKSAMIRKL